MVTENPPSALLDEGVADQALDRAQRLFHIGLVFLQHIKQLFPAFSGI
jgi:hypothetical protein